MALVVKNPPASAGDAGDMGSIPGSGRFPGEENCNPFQYSLPGESQGQQSLVGCHLWGHGVRHDRAVNTDSHTHTHTHI